MNNEPIIDTRKIATHDGVLVVEMTQTFIDKVRQWFDLTSDQDVTDDHVRIYVWGAVNNAVNKATRSSDDTVQVNQRLE